MGQRSFNNKSTTDDVLAGIDLAGKRALVTGGASGIGAETVRALAAHGAEVVIAARNLDMAGQVRSDVLAGLGASDTSDQISLLELELGSLRQIASAVETFGQSFDRLDLLINNAGIMACPQGKTEDGFELQFGTNHIGHFYFTNLMVPYLMQAAPARIVCLSSLAHRMSPVLFDDIHFESQPYDRWVSYGQSKTANALYALALNERLRPHQVEVFSVHPGIIQTRLARHMSREDLDALMKSTLERQASDPDPDPNHGGIKTVEQGAATSCYAATAPEIAGHGGVYLEDCQIAQRLTDPQSPKGYGVRPCAYDAAAAERLWDVSEKMVGRSFSF
jgi:NAD(P)-dependent dehydrogenase (short-subunit alcohol dehydrogenase family)